MDLSSVLKDVEDASIDKHIKFIDDNVNKYKNIGFLLKNI